MVQPWQKAMDEAELRRTVEARARDVARRYRGRFAEYDLNNEMLHGNYYEQRLGPDITRDMVSWMRQEDPQAVLYLNDYDILTGRRLEDYAAQIQQLLDQGVPIGGIGVQGHLHGDSFDPAVLRRALDRLAQFKLPIRVTEFNFPGQRSKYYGQRGARLTDDEERAKAQGLTDYYRICFANPAVEGILMWGFWEGATGFPSRPCTGVTGPPRRQPKPIEIWCSSNGGPRGKAEPTPRADAKSGRSMARTGSRPATRRRSSV